MNNTTCKNCGGDNAIHHYKTAQCPVGGREAPTGRKQDWKSTTFEPVEDALIGMQKRAEAAEARAAQLQAESAQYKSDAMRFESERNTAIDCADDYKAIIAQMKSEYKAQIEQLRAELATVKDERDALKRAMRDYMNDIFAHTAPPTDWDQETPYGQMLDGLGDEVEP